MDRRSFLIASVLALVTANGRAADEADPDEGQGIKDALPDPLAGDDRPPVVVDGERLALLRQVHQRVDRVRRTVGYGNFNLLGFDAMLAVARNYPRVGAFSRTELDLIDELFHADAARYGFHGRKVFGELTATIPDKEIAKVPYTGHFLYRGRAEAVYAHIRDDLGAENIFLTSGVRSTVKQLHLFLGKAVETGGNLSLASRSLAPPGYSFHGVGDFDVGKVGFGYLNFTAAFAATAEYSKLTQLGYVSIRYPEGNPDGVRFEPWHIKVV
jgi:D-alanyl-D-alanine carboxypeptidase